MDIPQFLAHFGDWADDRHAHSFRAIGTGPPGRQRPGAADLPTVPERSPRRAARRSW